MSNDTFTAADELPAVEALAPDPPPLMADALKRFVALEHERREIEDKLTANKAEAARLSEQLLDLFADLQLQNARMDGLTVYVRHDRYVSKAAGVETEAVCRALESCGWGYLVQDGYNAQSLKAKVAESLAEGMELPAELAPLLNVGEVPRVATRK